MSKTFYRIYTNKSIKIEVNFMSNKKHIETNIIEVRKASRSLGMSRGRVTRNIHADKVCAIRRFQMAFLLKEDDEVKKQSDFAKLLFWHG